jgi:hypothetical protein
MTNEQALEILNQATKNIPLTREQHQAIVAAIQTLNRAIESLSKD